MPPRPPLREPLNVLYRIQRGLSGYVSYLAACEMNTAFSEYVLYEPVLRILTARRYSARCEVAAPGVSQPDSGDRKRIDFVAEGHNRSFALEVKWAKKHRISVKKDYAKLVAFRESFSGTRSFLCVFGRESHIKNITLVPNSFIEVGKAVFANFRITKYGCRMFEASPIKALQPTSRARQKAKPKQRSRHGSRLSARSLGARRERRPSGSPKRATLEGG